MDKLSGMLTFWIGIASGICASVIFAAITHLCRKHYNPIVWVAEKDTLNHWIITRTARDEALGVAFISRWQDWIEDPSLVKGNSDLGKGDQAQFSSMSSQGTYYLMWIDKQGRRYTPIAIFENVERREIRRRDVMRGVPDIM